jgi:hypothetical protein
VEIVLDSRNAVCSSFVQSFVETPTSAKRPVDYGFHSDAVREISVAAAPSSAFAIR